MRFLVMTLIVLGLLLALMSIIDAIKIRREGPRPPRVGVSISVYPEKLTVRAKREIIQSLEDDYEQARKAFYHLD